jgi:D-galactarolactone isomerase
MVGAMSPERLRGACDTHVHFYDSRYAVADSALLRPADAHVADYRALQHELQLDRVVIVQPTTYGLDNSCQLDAAREFGEAARVVVVVGEETTDDELDRLHACGARGARFHMLPGGALGWTSLAPVSARIAERGWHVQLQMDGRLLPDRLPHLNDLPCPLVIDHVGRYMPPVDPVDDRFGALLRLLDGGRCWIKLSAPYESTPVGAPHYPAVGALVERLVAHAPERLVWATNWPHPGQDDPPSADDLMRLRRAWLPTRALERRVLVDNAIELYGFPPLRDTDRDTDRDRDRDTDRSETS